MPQLVRFGCAGIAVIIIAALTSVGLYAVLTGGSLAWGPTPKPVSGGAQVLVTIQAGQPTPTPLSAATPTPPSSQAAGPASPLAAPVAVAAPLPPTPTATPTLPAHQSVPGSGQAGPALPAGSPAIPLASPVTESARPGSAAHATHDGLTVAVVEIERGWQPADSAGAPIRPRDGHELLTVQVRLTNAAAEARYVADGDFALASEDGARYAPRTAGPQREPRLLTLPLLPGDSARGWLTFEMPVGTDARRIQWSPTRPDRPRADATYNLQLTP